MNTRIFNPIAELISVNYIMRKLSKFNTHVRVLYFYDFRKLIKKKKKKQIQKLFRKKETILFSNIMKYNVGLKSLALSLS